MHSSSERQTSERERERERERKREREGERGRTADIVGRVTETVSARGWEREREREREKRNFCCRKVLMMTNIQRWRTHYDQQWV